jgi:hypothetical protein
MNEKVLAFVFEWNELEKKELEQEFQNTKIVIFLLIFLILRRLKFQYNELGRFISENFTVGRTILDSLLVCHRDCSGMEWNEIEWIGLECRMDIGKVKIRKIDFEGVIIERKH